MTVWVLVHSEYDNEGIRGVFATKEGAEASLVTRAPSGARSRAWDAHSETCCYIEECEVWDAPVVTVQEDPAPFEGPVETVIPDAVIPAIEEFLTRPNPLRKP